jgi:DNA primase
VQACLDAAIPMVDLLWRQETEGRTFDSPERKAALDKALRIRIGAIKDEGLRHHYGMALKELRFQLFRPPRGPAQRRARAWNAPLPPSPTAKASVLVAEGEGAQTRLRQEVVLATLITYPDLAEAFETELEAMEPAGAEVAAVRDAVLSAIGAPDTLADRIGAARLERLLSARHISVIPCLRNRNAPDLARLTVAEELAKLAAERGWQAEVKEAQEDLETRASEALTWRLAEAAKTRASAGRMRDETETEYDIGPNGAHIDREERSQLDSLLSSIRFEKPRR